MFWCFHRGLEPRLQRTHAGRTQRSPRRRGQGARTRLTLAREAGRWAEEPDTHLVLASPLAVASAGAFVAAGGQGESPKSRGGGRKTPADHKAPPVDRWRQAAGKQKWKRWLSGFCYGDLIHGAACLPPSLPHAACRMPHALESSIRHLAPPHAACPMPPALFPSSFASSRLRVRPRSRSQRPEESLRAAHGPAIDFLQGRRAWKPALPSCAHSTHHHSEFTIQHWAAQPPLRAIRVIRGSVTRLDRAKLSAVL